MSYREALGYAKQLDDPRQGLMALTDTQKWGRMLAYLHTKAASQPTEAEAPSERLATRDQLEAALSQCAEAFPIPARGAPTEDELLASVADPLAVPAFVRAALATQPTQAEGLPERDPVQPAERQGLFRKFDVRRTDGSDGPGGKHEACEYFVLDVKHDAHAAAALAAYADAAEGTHPLLARDMRTRYGLPTQPPQAEPPSDWEQEIAKAKATYRVFSPESVERLVRAALATHPAPEQVEPWHGIDVSVLLQACMKPEEIGGDAEKQHNRVQELLHWFVRLQRGNANPNWLRGHAAELAYYIAIGAMNRAINLKPIRDAAFTEGVNISHAERSMLQRILPDKFPAHPAPEQVERDRLLELLRYCRSVANFERNDEIDAAIRAAREAKKGGA